MQENGKDASIAKLDFGANGNVELTSSRLLASVKGEATIASLSGIKTGVNEEMRIKLDQLKNFGILPPAPFHQKGLFFTSFWGLPVFIPLLGFAFGCLFGAVTFFFIVGFLAAIATAIWVIRKTPKMLKKFRCAYLIFSSPEGSNVSIPFEVSRMQEVEGFAQTVKKTQSAYVDSL